MGLGSVRATVGGPQRIALGRRAATAFARGPTQSLAASVPAGGISSSFIGARPNAEIKTPQPPHAETVDLTIRRSRKVKGKYSPREDQTENLRTRGEALCPAALPKWRQQPHDDGRRARAVRTRCWWLPSCG